MNYEVGISWTSCKSLQYKKEVYVDENGNEVDKKTDLTKLAIDEVQKGDKEIGCRTEHQP